MGRVLPARINHGKYPAFHVSMFLIPLYLIFRYISIPLYLILIPLYLIENDHLLPE